jgi:hypothetical protein
MCEPPVDLAHANNPQAFHRLYHLRASIHAPMIFGIYTWAAPGDRSRVLNCLFGRAGTFNPACTIPSP